MLPSTLGPLHMITPDKEQAAISKMKYIKALGTDQISVELWKHLGNTGIAWLTNLFNIILESAKIPDMWRTSNLIPFFKNKGDITDFGNYRTIKLTSHTLKIWESVMVRRITRITRVSANQCSFTSGASTTDAIHSVKLLMEKYKLSKKDFHVIFTDLEKAFDRVPGTLIWQALRAQCVPEL